MTPKYNCELIQDILPLYQDEICSAYSHRIVEEHLQECETCAKIMEKLKNDHVETRLTEEKNKVLNAHSRKERKKTFLAGSAVAGILMIPVIVCLICNLAIGHGLDWFFIVLTALLLTASVSVVPLMVSEHTWFWTLGCSTVSLLLLLLTICLYTGGNWFFLAAVPVLFALSVLFMPLLVRYLPLYGPFARHRALLVMGWDTLWLYGVIVVCGFHTAVADYWRIALQITSFCALLPWALFLIIRYTRLQVQIKAGLCTLTSGLFGVLINPVISLILLDPKSPISQQGFWLLLWNDNIAKLATSVIIAAVTIPTGIALIVTGWIRQRHAPVSTRPDMPS